MAKRFHWRDQPWFTWSDGRSFTDIEARKFRFVLDRQRVRGESHRKRFERVRTDIEQYEAKKKAVLITEPGVIAKAWNWLTGRPNAVKLEAPLK